MREIYLDNSATTRTDPEVASYIADVMVNQYGNPSSLHRRGLMAQLEWEKGLKRIAAVLGCDPGCITITSGGTEADNLAIFGGAQAKSAGATKSSPPPLNTRRCWPPSASWKNRGSRRFM